MSKKRELKMRIANGDFARLEEDLRSMGWQLEGEGNSLELKVSNRLSLPAKLGELRSVIGHDLASPARTLKLIVELMNRNPESLDPELVSTIPLQADLLMSLSFRLEQWVKLLVTPLQIQETSFCTILRESIPDELAGQVEYESLRQADPQVMCDPALMQLLLRELFDNAGKFAKTPVKVEASQSKSMFEFKLSDDGAGIEEKYRESIFTLGRRLHPKSTIPGDGIGLSICKHVAESHGGSILVAPGSSAGCTMLVSIPQL